MRKLFVSAAASAMCVAASSAMAEDCGTVTMAEMNWASAGAIAHIDKIILENGYGCTVELVTGDTMPTFTSMNEKAEPDIAPELWINAVREPLDAAVAEGELIIGGEVLNEGGVEGFWIPTYLAEEHNIYTVEDALARPDLFPGAEDESKGAFFTCPTGWNCRITTGNLFRAFDAENKGFELVDSGSAAGLDGSIARAFERDQGWLGYYWAPTAILGKYDMTLLDFEVPHNKEEWDTCTVIEDCPNPQKNSWVKSEVFTVVTDEFADKAGVAMDYVKGRTWDNRTAGKVLAWMQENQATNEDGAYYFLENHEDVWSNWVPADVAEKVKAAL
ncbi:glycine betaine/proline transport system substrate-binding protein [Roseibium hamelinense]|uniref:Glycine betaine/proline transport system substrate-binding protein n=1 Tax=Roseibium hamelinense TaxID=150831 RepID=A0A562SNB4_9HYPH|nr:ABC transporter substrate-binding protein [Roseibium hamelinense]MTI42251.1 ABC transporter substrate-binding protein [Roseibium hamelinense]TWI82146.1 glycine betaine/proline transport system substrate-binding protein [Roseibium hamelinense]